MMGGFAALRANGLREFCEGTIDFIYSVPVRL